jgi:hypothetical protein
MNTARLGLQWAAAKGDMYRMAEELGEELAITTVTDEKLRQLAVRIDRIIATDAASEEGLRVWIEQHIQRLEQLEQRIGQIERWMDQLERWAAERAQHEP